MKTEMPKWLESARKDMQSRMHSPKFQPHAGSNTLMDQASQTQAKVLRSEAATSGHNVFRPDVYRVSEGYLN